MIRLMIIANLLKNLLKLLSLSRNTRTKLNRLKKKREKKLAIKLQKNDYCFTEAGGVDCENWKNTITQTQTVMNKYL